MRILAWEERGKRAQELVLDTIDYVKVSVECIAILSLKRFASFPIGFGWLERM